MAADKRLVVEIFGEQFPLKTDGDEAHVRRVAAKVDRRIRELARKTSGIPGLRLGILAALQFAEEYSQLKKDYDDLVDMVERRKTDPGRK